MIEPDNITNYNRNEDELIELFIFCVFVAGHNAHTTAINLNRFLTKHVGWTGKLSLADTLFAYLASHSDKEVIADLKDSSIGCYTRHSKFLRQLNSALAFDLDLKNAPLSELEEFTGVGPKTSRFFVMHSRKGVDDIAVLDTHVLKFMGEHGIKVPKATPSGKRYRELEKEFLRLAADSGKSLADFDLEVWKSRRIKTDARK